MQIIRKLGPLRDALDVYRKSDCKMGLVPTMGALHAGHMRLVEVAVEQCDIVVASIFVNPAQFSEGEDLETYPRQEAEDFALLEAAGVELVWAPSLDQIYPENYSTKVNVGGLSEGLDTLTRPDFFEGIATVVTKLFNQIRPHAAYFGEKDFQQLSIIKRLTRDLDFTHEVVGVETVREKDGLALSSRNAYLSEEERSKAAVLPRIMAESARKMAEGGDVVLTLDDAKADLLRFGFHTIDYLEVREAATLEPVEKIVRPSRLFAAAHIGTTRLIDNIAIG
ncbi:MAG: pantoate--beta-alanine ligase [Parasphingorhabdus sp.]